MIEIDTKAGKILLVEIPDEVFVNANIDYPDWHLYDTIFDTELVVMRPPKGTSDYTVSIKYPFNKLSLLGKFNELSDKDLEPFIEFEDFENDFEGWRHYKSYLPEDKCELINSCCLETIRESFISLCESQGVEINDNYLIIKVL